MLPHLVNASTASTTNLPGSTESWIVSKSFSEIAMLGYGAQYVWVDFDMYTIDIGESCFINFSPVALSIQRLRFAREVGSESFDRWEVDELQEFANAKEIWVLPLDGLIMCMGLTDDHWFPCGTENVFCIDPKNNKRVFRGSKGEAEIGDIFEAFPKQDKDFLAL